MNLGGEELGGVGDCSNWNILYKKSYFKFKRRRKRVSWGSLTSWHMPAFLVPGR